MARAGARPRSSVKSRQGQQNDRAGERQHTKPGMDQITDGEKQRHPRQVDNGNGSLAGEEGAELVKVTHRPMRLDGPAVLACQADHGIVDQRVEAQIEQRGDPHHQARAHHLEPALECVSHNEKG